MKHHAWLWPDHNIGKRESRRLREEHNALYNSHAELLEALDELTKRSSALDQSATDDGLKNCIAISTARNAINKAKGNK